MVTRRGWMQGTLLAGFFGAAAPARARTDTLPWRNWSGALSCQPLQRVVPASESALVDFFRSTTGTVRPVGSGHSFSPLVPTDGHLLVLDAFNGILAHDADTLQATIGAGARLGDLGPALARIGQEFFNLPDIDRQTLAGATATGTHGTGIDFPALSGYVTALRLVTPQGKVIDARHHPAAAHRQDSPAHQDESGSARQSSHAPQPLIISPIGCFLTPVSRSLWPPHTPCARATFSNV